MKLIRKDFKDRIPQELLYVLNHINYPSYIVGGAVRDWLQGKVEKDFDIEVFAPSYDALVKELCKQGLEPKVDDRKFGIVRVKLETIDEPIEFSLPRKDNKVGEHHNEFFITYEGDDAPKTVREASIRRDFTINSIYLCTKTFEVTDCWGGIQDLENKVLRVVDEATFLEDPLRIWRMLPAITKNNIRTVVIPDIDFRGLDLMVTPTARWNEVKKALSVEHMTVRAAERFMYVYSLLTSPDEPSYFINRHRTLVDFEDYFSGDKLLEVRLSLLDRHTGRYKKHYKGASRPVVSMSTYLGIPKEIQTHLGILSDVGYYFVDLMFWSQEIYPLYEPHELVEYHSLISPQYATHHMYDANNELCRLGWYNKPPEPIVTGDFLINKIGLKPSEKFSKLIHEGYRMQVLECFDDIGGAVETMERYISTGGY